MTKNRNTEYTINIGGRLLSLREPLVMGILNCTPDSFYQGSRKQSEMEIAERANRIIEEGGKIIDVGAFSTRPGATQVSEEEEMERMRHALTAIRGQQADAIVSIDTFRHDVAKMAVEEFGVGIINDVSGGNPEGSFGSDKQAVNLEASDIDGNGIGSNDCAPVLDDEWRGGVPYILMSSCGSLEDTMKFFAMRIRQLRARGQREHNPRPRIRLRKDDGTELRHAPAHGFARRVRTPGAGRTVAQNNDMAHIGHHTR